jgi:antitoxin VapB
MVDLLPYYLILMALSIKNPETDRLAHELAELTGDSVTVAVTKALRQSLEAVNATRPTPGLLDDIRQIQNLVASLPRIDDRTPDEIIGYDEFGLPT